MYYVIFYTVTTVHDLEGEHKEQQCLSISDILGFVSGAHQIPPMGFKKRFTLSFHDSRFPHASTCSLELSIPTRYKIYKDFRDAMVEGLVSGMGFGTA